MKASPKSYDPKNFEMMSSSFHLNKFKFCEKNIGQEMVTVIIFRVDGELKNHGMAFEGFTSSRESIIHS